MEYYKRHIVALICLITVAGITSQAWSYSRNRVGISSPGSLRSVGSSSGSFNSFRGQAAGVGVGALSTSKRGYSGNVLNSSLKRSGMAYTAGKHMAAGSSPLKSGLTSSFGSSNIRRSAGTSSIGTSVVGRTSKSNIPVIAPSKSTKYTGKQYNLPTSAEIGTGQRNKAVSVLQKGVTDISAKDSFLQAIGGDSIGKLKESDVITSFAVETEEGEENAFNEHIKTGEEFFQDEEFTTAYEEFEYAKDLDSKSPEALISMAHAKFAHSVYDYPSASYYLQQALIYFPELPLVKLRPKKFYSFVETYVTHIERLENHLADHELDTSANLLNAYYKWFTDNPDITQIKNSLQIVVDHSDNDQRIEAAKIFWDAIVASGKATGKLTKTPVKKE